MDSRLASRERYRLIHWDAVDPYSLVLHNQARFVDFHKEWLQSMPDRLDRVP